MRTTRTLLIGSFLWALAFIVAAFVFRGRAVGTWIEGLLFVGWTVYFYYGTARAECAR